MKPLPRQTTTEHPSWGPCWPWQLTHKGAAHAFEPPLCLALLQHAPVDLGGRHLGLGHLACRQTRA